MAGVSDGSLKFCIFGSKTSVTFILSPAGPWNPKSLLVTDSHAGLGQTIGPMEWGSRNEIPKLREVAGRHRGGGEGIKGTRKGETCGKESTGR